MHSGIFDHMHALLILSNKIYYIQSIILFFLRGKNPDSQYATSMVFGVIENSVYLYGMYRDDHIRMWSAKTGQCVSIVNCVPNNSEARARGCKLWHIYFFIKKLP